MSLTRKQQAELLAMGDAAYDASLAPDDGRSPDPTTVSMPNLGKSPDSVRLLRLLNDNREDIMRIAGNRGATNLRVFGSVASGTAEEGSDIDLLVDFPDQPAGQQPMNAAGLSVELEELLGVRVDVLVLEFARQKIAESVCAGRIIEL